MFKIKSLIYSSENNPENENFDEHLLIDVDNHYFKSLKNVLKRTLILSMFYSKLYGNDIKFVLKYKGIYHEYNLDYLKINENNFEDVIEDMLL